MKRSRNDTYYGVTRDDVINRVPRKTRDSGRTFTSAGKTRSDRSPGLHEHDGRERSRPVRQSWTIVRATRNLPRRHYSSRVPSCNGTESNCVEPWTKKNKIKKNLTELVKRPAVSTASRQPGFLRCFFDAEDRVYQRPRRISHANPDFVLAHIEVSITDFDEIWQKCSVLEKNT